MKKSKAVGLSALWFGLFLGAQLLITFVFIIGGIFYGRMELTAFIDGRLPEILALQNILTAAIALLTARKSRNGVQGALGIQRTKPSGVIIPALFALSLSAVLTFLLSVISLPETTVENYDALMETVTGGENSALNAVSVIFLAPLCEELIFRGAIFQTLKKSFSPAAAAVISSAMFGLAHFNLIQSTYAFFVGLLLCLVCHRFGSLWSSLAAHMAFNIAGGYVDLSRVPPPCDKLLLIAATLITTALTVWMLLTEKKSVIKAEGRKF